jgi:hypothetical protein
MSEGNGNGSKNWTFLSMGISGFAVLSLTLFIWILDDVRQDIRDDNKADREDFREIRESIKEIGEKLTSHVTKHPDAELKNLIVGLAKDSMKHEAQIEKLWERWDNPQRK